MTFEIIPIPEVHYGAGSARGPAVRPLYLEIMKALEELPVGRAIRVPVAEGLTQKAFAMRVASAFRNPRAKRMHAWLCGRRIHVVQAGEDAVAVWLTNEAAPTPANAEGAQV